MTGTWYKGRVSLSHRRALVLMATAAVLFGVMAYLTKHATARLGGAQAAFIRFVIGALVAGAQAGVRKQALRPNRWDLLVARGVLGGVAVLLYFMALSKIPVGTATLLHYTAPIWTAGFAALFLHERLRRPTVIALAVALAGVALVVYGQGKALGGVFGWQLLAVGSAVVSGAAVTTIRAARRHDGAWEIFMSMCVIGMLCTAPFAFANWGEPTSREWLLLVSMGLVAVVAQILMTHAFGALPAATGGIIQQLTVGTALFLGVLVDNEPLTGLSAAGVLLTLGGVSLAARVSATTHGRT